MNVASHAMFIGALVLLSLSFSLSLSSPPLLSLSPCLPGTAQPTIQWAALYPTMTHSIPVYRVGTHNVRGLHPLARKPGAKLRKANNLCALARSHDVTFFQETRLSKPGANYLKRIVPPDYAAGVFTSCLSASSAGVAIVISPKVLAQYKARLVPLPTSLDGKAIVLELTPEDGDADALILVNVYLEAGDNFAKKLTQLNTLTPRVPRTGHLIMGGDFNFVEDKHVDSSSTSAYYDVTGKFRSKWANFVTDRGLREVSQGSHTFFSVERAKPCSSRLDRFYISHSEAEWAAARPHSYISHIPHSLLHRKKGDDVGISDHLPVTLYFSPEDSKETRGPNIPRWIADSPRFRDHFEARWQQRVPHLEPSEPFHLLSALKATLFEASKACLQENRERKELFRDEIGELTRLVKALRCHCQPRPAYASDFLQRHPGLGDPRKLRARIADLLERADVEGDSDLPPSDHASPRSKGPAPLANIKPHLPSTRTRLYALRPDVGSAPTSDPDEMAKLAARYWASIWSERARGEECIDPDTYYGDFSREIPPSLMPKCPALSDILDAISTTTNSCGGPDGIPFSAWRAVKQHAAPVLHLVLKSICAGRLPPDGFNHGLLFLLPKKGTLLPSDTRPISVTNADNRILAKAVVTAITPALQATLHKAQKGFVQGRQFEDHIRDLNEKFYEMVEEGPAGENFFILFMDTAKAFDSIDHVFVHEAVKRAGLPDWFSHLVRGLLHQVKVKPSFRGAADHWIDIRRGVKQGCPLSPLLFIICYDVLLERLGRLEGSVPRACADDLAVSTHDFFKLWDPMLLVDAFRRASGLGINEDKTRIVSARPSDISRYIQPRTMTEFQRRCPWRGVKEALRYKYLGILFGREVRTGDIFEIALTQLADRATSYRPALKHLAHSARVLAYNTFIFSKISYLIRFFHVPYTTKAGEGAEGVITRHARLITLPLPHAYSYTFLVSPDNKVSPPSAVRDAWATSMAMLVEQADLRSWQGQGEEDGSITCYPGDNDSMRISRHVRSAAIDFVCRVTADTGAAFDAAPFEKDTGAGRRKAIYDCLVRIDYQGTADAELERVLGNRGLSECKELVPILHANFALLSKPFPPHFRCTQFELTTNCLFTHNRLLPIDQRDRTARLGMEKSPCIICGLGTDSIQHIFGGECGPVVAARTLVTRCLRFYSTEGGVKFEPFPDLEVDTLRADNFWSVSLLAFPRPGKSLTKVKRRAAVRAAALFNGVVWYERQYYFKSLSNPPELPDAANRIAAMVALSYLRLQAPKISQGLGSAGRRSAVQKQMAREHARQAIASVGPGALVGFTDGSASPNPGPSGAGMYMYSSTPGDEWSHEAVAALGKGTNNLGEFWAIGMSVQTAGERIQLSPPDTYDHHHVFTDSMFVKSCISRTWKSKKFEALIEAICSLISALPVPTTIHWVPAHVGVQANEHADFLAGLGTSRSAVGNINVNTAEDHLTRNFLPHNMSLFINQVNDN